MTNNSIAELANIKIGRVGGLTKAKQMRDFCVSFGIKMNIEETGGTFLADSAAVHLAQSTPTEFHHATWLCGDMLNENLLTNNHYSNNIAGGAVKAPNGPGLGVAPNINILGQPFLEVSKNKLTI